MDIVERLRASGIEGGDNWKKYQEAADEIERLRSKAELLDACQIMALQQLEEIERLRKIIYELGGDDGHR